MQPDEKLRNGCLPWEAPENPYPAQILQKVEDLRESMTRDLQSLIRIPSVKGAPEEGAPFGTAVRDALSCMLTLGAREGFRSADIDGFGGHLDFGEGQETIGILCHLDVVPEGTDWEHAPYDAVVEDGVMYGRGTLDDKGPTIAAFYAMKALKDCGCVPEKRIRMILGLDEETGSEGMRYYLQREPAPDFAIVPDSDFPLVCGEMGILVFDLVRKFSGSQMEGLTLKSLSGGNAPNMVPEEARAVLFAKDRTLYEPVREAAAHFEALNGCAVRTRGRGTGLEIICRGQSAHGAAPWKGKNAISGLMEFLHTIPIGNEDVRDFIEFYQTHLGNDFHGERMGCTLEDGISGKLILNVGMIEMDRSSVRLTVNVRCPISYSDADVYQTVADVIDPAGIGIVKKMYEKPLYFSPDEPVVKLLCDIYGKQTGDVTTKPLVIGGGTYARQIDRGMAYGALFPGDPDLMHQRNECVRIDRLVKTAQIYAEALYRLAVSPEISFDPGTGEYRNAVEDQK